MASPTTDPLLLFRQSIRTSSRIVPVASAESNDEVALSQATNLVFSDEGKRVVLPVDVQSRFMSSEGNLIDLRSIYFAWVNRDITIPEYNAAAEKLNEELAGGKGVHKFPFVERLNLIAWLEGAGEDTEYIKPLVGGDAGKGEEGGKVEKVGDDGGVKKERRGKGTLDPRLAQIYEGERRMGDRNSVLRGIKPTVGGSKDGAFWEWNANIFWGIGLFAYSQAGCAVHD